MKCEVETLTEIKQRNGAEFLCRMTTPNTRRRGKGQGKIDETKSDKINHRTPSNFWKYNSERYNLLSPAGDMLKVKQKEITATEEDK